MLIIFGIITYILFKYSFDEEFKFL